MLDFTKICRVCMVPAGELSLIFEYKHDDYNLNMAQILSECTMYRVDRNDKLPQLICADCKKSANTALKFKRHCEQSYRILFNIINGTKKVLSNCNGIFDGNKEVSDESTQTEDLNTLTNGKTDNNMLNSHANQFALIENVENRNHEKGKGEKICDSKLCIPDQELTNESLTKDDSAFSNEETHISPSISFDIESTNKKITQINSDDHSDDDRPLSILKCAAPSKGFFEVLVNESFPVEEQKICTEDTLGNADFPKSSNYSSKSKRCHIPKSSSHENAHSDQTNNRKLRNNVSRNVGSEFIDNNNKKSGDSSKKITDSEIYKILTEKSHKCKICNKSFTTKIYLHRHMSIHGKTNPFICKECSQSYATKEELNDHIKTEGHDKLLLCPECGLRCKTSNILMVHMRRHRGEKPFKCKFCSKGFPRTDDLRVHEKYHTGEKSHFCETCGKGFQRKYNLTIHLRVHTGEKPYKCPHCLQAFTQGNDLKAHIRRHTGERFRCHICGASFMQSYKIRQHKLLEHGIKEEPPTQRIAKFISLEEQQQQIKQNLLNSKDKNWRKLTAKNP